MGILTRRPTKLDARQGTLDPPGLTRLGHGPDQCFGIATVTQTISADALRVEEGSIYRALRRGEQSGWIVPAWHVTADSRRARPSHLARAGPPETDAAKGRLVTAAVATILRDAEV